MPEVELVYDADCPNPALARAQLLRALVKAGLVARWREWLADDADAPPHVRGYGSPTVLVDGRDVAGAVPVEGMRSCRVYDGAADGPRGAPSVELIVAALLRSQDAVQLGRARKRRAPGSALAMLPALGMSLLPKVACPACWPAYAGFLSALGLGFLLNTTVLLPLTAAFLAIALSALAFRAQRRRGYRPLALGVLAAGVVLAGKFSFESDAAMYGGLAILVAASIWNTWPAGRKAESCPACSPPPVHPDE
jgi:mercuric ion transport protein